MKFLALFIDECLELCSENLAFFFTTQIFTRAVKKRKLCVYFFQDLPSKRENYIISNFKSDSLHLIPHKINSVIRHPKNSTSTSYHQELQVRKSVKNFGFTEKFLSKSLVCIGIFLCRFNFCNWTTWKLKNGAICVILIRHSRGLKFRKWNLET